MRKAEQIKFTEAKKLRDQNKYVEALALVEEVLRAYPKDLPVIFLAGYLHWELGGLRKAAECFKVGTEICPESEIASLGLFHVLWEMGDQVRALDEVKRFMSISFSQDYVDIVREINKTQK